jgi:hypothetical protein
MTTGSANFDSLIDSVQEGQCYLFYGSKKILEGLVHGLLVNCVLLSGKSMALSQWFCISTTSIITNQINPSC